jgi:ribosome-associated toxin RatA of RatAB toxin-antitoxin module
MHEKYCGSVIAEESRVISRPNQQEILRMFWEKISMLLSVKWQPQKPDLKTIATICVFIKFKLHQKLWMAIFKVVFELIKSN